MLLIRVPPAELNISAPPPPVLRDWVIKGLGMSSLVYATGHIKDPVPLIEKRRGLSPGGRFPPSFLLVSEREREKERERLPRCLLLVIISVNSPGVKLCTTCPDSVQELDHHRPEM